MNITIKAKLMAGIKYDADAKVYVTYVPALGIYSQGENIIQAKFALDDAVKSFFTIAHKKGVLHTLLEKAKLSTKREYITVEEKILEKNNFEDIFPISTNVPLIAEA
jgi:hypothetical protein